MKTKFSILAIFISLALTVAVNSHGLNFLEDIKIPSIAEYEEKISVFLTELKDILNTEFSDQSLDKIIIRKDLLEKLQKLEINKLWELSSNLEREFEKDEQKAKENLEKKEKESIIDYLRKKYHDKKELRDLLKHLDEKTVVELRQLAKDLEYKYEPDPKKAEQNLLKAMRKYIIYYIDEKYHIDKNKTEKFLEEALKDDLHERYPLVIGDGLHDYIATMDKDSLIDVCIAIEFYHRKITGDKAKEDYHMMLHRMNEHDLMTRIMDEAEEHPELNNIKKIDEIMIQFKNTKPEKKVEEKPERKAEQKLGEGIEMYLSSLQHDDLIKLAYSAEKVHKKAKGIEGGLGGLHDYVWKLKDEEIRKIIVKEALENPDEMNKLEKIMMMVNEGVLFLANDDINDRKQNKNKIIISDKIKKKLKSCTSEELMKIVEKLLDTIKYDDEIFLNLDFDDLNTKSLRKLIKRLIRRHPEKLNRDDLYNL